MRRALLAALALLALPAHAGISDTAEIRPAQGKGMRAPAAVIQNASQWIASNTCGGTFTGPGPVTVSRSTSETYLCADGTLHTAAANTLAVTEQGAQLFRSVQNLVLRSESMDNAAWTATGGIVNSGAGFVDVGPDPKGGTTADKLDNTAGANTDDISQSVTTSGSGPFIASAWVAATTGTAPQSVGAQCPSGNASSCSCWVSSGSCTAATSTSLCYAYTTAGTTPVRLSATTNCVGGASSLLIRLSPGQRGISTGVGYFWGAQLRSDSGRSAGPYVATAGSPVTNSGSLVSFASPMGTAVVPFCTTAVVNTPGQWADNGYIAASGVGGGAHQFRFTYSYGDLVFATWSDASAYGSWSNHPAFAAGSEHTITTGYNPAAPSVAINIDGSAVSVTAAPAVAPTSLVGFVYVGMGDNYPTLDGFLKRIKFCWPTSKPGDCL